MLHKLSVKTAHSCQLIDITGEISEIVKKTGVQQGLCCIYVTHTTAGVTINENADPDVTTDILCGLEHISPVRSAYKHAEGNSPAHIKSSMVGPSLTVIIDEGKLVLGTWQSIFFCEFDGPRSRSALVKVVQG